MISLGAGNTIQGVSGSTAAITYTISGDEVSSGIDAFKVLAQGQLITAVNVLYTVPVGAISLVKQVLMSNPTAGAATARLFVNGSANANEVMPQISIPAGGLAIWTGESFQVFNSAGTLQTGLVGPTGLIGPIGPPGMDGPEGPEGPEGQRGGTGATGSTAFPTPLIGPPGFDGDEGPEGPVGTAGPQGIQGVQGVAGIDGTPGGAKGDMGIMGTPGVDGEDGADGASWPQATVGMEFLGATLMAADATTTAVVTIPRRDVLVILVRVVGYSGGGDIAALRFNADAGANYWSRYLTAAAGVATLTNQVNVSQAFARLFGVAITTGRSAIIHVSNRLGTSKSGAVRGQSGTGAAATSATLEFGGFEWVNTAAQISSVTMLTAAGQNLLTGSGFAVFGRNLV